jgi:hypothetical protein
MKNIFRLILIGILIIINFDNIKKNITESFESFYYIPMFLDHTNLPWSNTRRSTRNTSYDLRGDIFPYKIPPRENIWNN